MLKNVARVMNEDSTQTLEALAGTLNVDLSSINHFETFTRNGNGSKARNWVPYELAEKQQENRKITCELLLERQKRKGFLYRIVTGDEKWVHYDNPKRKKVWVKPGEPLVNP